MNFLQNLDDIAKGWKRLTTSGVFLGITAWTAAQGYDLVPVVHALEESFLAISALYGAIITLLGVADKANKS